VKRVLVSSLNGVYETDNQQYVMLDGSSANHLSLACGFDSTYRSEGLCAFIEKWASDLAYEKLSALLGEHVGSPVLCGVGIKKYLMRKALAISEKWSSGADGGDIGIAVSESVGLYDRDRGEVIVMMDDVGVKAQKPHKKIARDKDDSKRIETTVALVGMSEETGKPATGMPAAPSGTVNDAGTGEKTDAEKPIPYVVLTEGISADGAVAYPIGNAISDTVKRLYYGDSPVRPLPVVAITDGARSIRLTLEAVFGAGVCIILDWYHLQLKVKNLMSMIAPDKTLKELYVRELQAFLWQGKTQRALECLTGLPKVKNAEKLEELVTYLKKHQTEIIDYEKRKQAGKTIGSGRCEKANDIVVAHRQKKKGTAWSRQGSKSLAIITVNRLNKAA